MIFETERLILREYTAEDFASLFAIVGDKETMKFFPKPYDEKGTKFWIDWSCDHYKQHGFGFWAVILKERGQLIGNCGLTLQTIDGEVLPEIGYHINKDYWHKGYAKEAAKGVMDWAFENTGYNAVYSYMTRSNTPSYSTAESIGMKRVKKFTDDHYGEMYAYAITRDEWDNTNK